MLMTKSPFLSSGVFDNCSKLSLLEYMLVNAETLWVCVGVPDSGFKCSDEGAAGGVAGSDMADS